MHAYGTDSVGKKYDLEVQRQDKGADPHRARYHSSVMDIENLHSGQEFKELPDTYTIFIIEKDLVLVRKCVGKVISLTPLPFLHPYCCGNSLYQLLPMRFPSID